MTQMNQQNKIEIYKLNTKNKRQEEEFNKEIKECLWIFIDIYGYVWISLDTRLLSLANPSGRGDEERGGDKTVEGKAQSTFGDEDEEVKLYGE